MKGLYLLVCGLKRNRKSQKSLLSFSRSCDISNSTIRSWTNGVEIPASAIEKLSCAGLDTGYILTGRRSAPPASAPSPLLRAPQLEQRWLWLKADRQR